MLFFASWWHHVQSMRKYSLIILLSGVVLVLGIPAYVLVFFSEGIFFGLHGAEGELASA